MTIWLVVVGMIAVFWPLILVYKSEESVIGPSHRNLQNVAQFADNKFKAVDQSLAELIQIVSKQDELIAVLWSRVYGYDPGRGGFVGDHYIATSFEDFVIAWGVSPYWHVNIDHVLGEYTTMMRKSPNPWGSDRHLYKQRDE